MQNQIFLYFLLIEINFIQKYTHPAIIKYYIIIYIYVLRIAFTTPAIINILILYFIAGNETPLGMQPAARSQTSECLPRSCAGKIMDHLDSFCACAVFGKWPTGGLFRVFLLLLPTSRPPLDFDDTVRISTKVKTYFTSAPDYHTGNQHGSWCVHFCPVRSGPSPSPSRVLDTLFSQLKESKESHTAYRL